MDEGMKETKPSNWYEAVGIPADVASKMPYMAFCPQGRVKINRLDNDAILVIGSGDASVNIPGVNYIYRFEPKTGNIKLVYFYSIKNIPGISAHSSLDDMYDSFGKFLTIKQGFDKLASLMGVDSETVKSKFTGVETEGCDQIKFIYSGGPKISIIFNKKGALPGIRCKYDYNIETNIVELLYSNDGHGKMWKRGQY